MNTNLKLVTISLLIEARVLEYDEALCETTVEKIEDDEELSDDMYGAPIPELVDYFAQLDITAQLDQVRQLSLDGGRAIYQLATYFWDGEDEVFDITSLEGIETLVNLESIQFDHMVSGSISLKPLASLKKLRQVSLNYNHFIDYEALLDIASLEQVTLSFTHNKEVAPLVALLKAKGLTVTIA